MGFCPNVISASCFFMKVESVAYGNTDIDPELWRILKRSGLCDCQFLHSV